MMRFIISPSRDPCRQKSVSETKKDVTYFLDLSSEEVSSADVSVAELLDELGALGALA